MADPSSCPPLTPESIRVAHARIKKYIHITPTLTCRTLDHLASTAREGETDASVPKVRLFFKCENLQKIGAFKARGAHHAVLHLVDTLGIQELRRRGVTTHSSGNHAQALALAAYTFDVPSFIVMPTISTPSKIAGTRQYTKNVFFSGSTHQEREAKVAEVVAQTGAIVVPPYDHPDILLGQGTVGLEIQQQHYQLSQSRRSLNSSNGQSQIRPQGSDEETSLRAVVAPIGGGGLLGGIATYFSQDPSDSPASMESAMKTYVFGAEPSFQGADDARRGLLPDPPRRIEYVKSLTIADGLRTPVGVLNWTVVSDKRKVEGVYAVTEQQIKETMRLVLERMKLVVEPSGCVALAVVLFNEEWRRWVADMQRTEALKMGLSDRRHISWDVAVVFSGGNTTAEAIGKLFDKEKEEKGEKVEGNVSRNDSKSVEEVAG